MNISYPTLPNTFAMQELLTNLNELTDGLLYTSESDYPFDTFLLDATKPIEEQLLEKAKKPKRTHIETRAWKGFFDNYTVAKDWWSDAEKNTAERYRNIVTTVEANAITTDGAKDIKVYRIGTTQVSVYIVVHLPENQYVVLATTAIET